MRLWVPSQNGLLADPPQRQSANTSSVGRVVPSASCNDPRFLTRYGPFSRISIVGDEDIGGVVDEVALGEDSEIKHPELLECLRESMYSVTFEPPEGYGTVRVTYPIVFAQAPPDGE